MLKVTDTFFLTWDDAELMSGTVIDSAYDNTVVDWLPHFRLEDGSFRYGCFERGVYRNKKSKDETIERIEYQESSVPPRKIANQISDKDWGSK